MEAQVLSRHFPLSFLPQWLVAVAFDCYKDLWVSVEVTHDDGEYPIGIDNGPAVDERGDWWYDNSSGWVELQESGSWFDVNWLIEVCFQLGPPNPVLEHVIS